VSPVVIQTSDVPTIPVPASTPRRSAARAWADSLFILGTAGVLMMAFFLLIYRAHRLPVPLGWDTSKYVWRSTLVRAFGIGGQTGHVAAPGIADPSRPGFPVIALTLGSILRANTFQMAAVLPAVSAAGIGLAAGAFAAVNLRLFRWEAVVASLLVGTSAFVVRLAAPEAYQDNLFAAAVFMAAAIAIGLSLEDRRALVPAILLFGAGGVIHWAFFVFMVATIALAAATYVPRSLRTWRAGEQAFLDTPAIRLGTVVVGGAAIGGATIFGVLSTRPEVPRLARSEFAAKLHRDVPMYRFPITLPLAAVGAVSLSPLVRWVRTIAGRGRFVLTFLLAWCAVTLAGVLTFTVLHVDVPAHRFLSYALAIPVLAVIGLLWLADLASRWRPAAAMALVTVALAGAGYSSHVLWFRNVPYIDPSKVEDAATARTYLDAAHIGDGRPVVFLVGEADGSYTALMSHMIRSVLPARRIDDAYIYVGSPENYLARRPTPTLSGSPNPFSLRYLGYLRPTYGRHPVALILRSFDPSYFAPWAQAHPGTIVAPNVAVVTGPTLTSPLLPAPFPVGGLGAIRVGFLAVASLAILAAIGLGWALSLLGRWLGPFETLAAAPAVGIAALVMVGVLIDSVGVRLAGAPGVAAPVVAGVGGWALAALQGRFSGPRRAGRSGR
jgi:hypothetical protein